MTDLYWDKQPRSRIRRAFKAALWEMAQIEDALAEGLGYPRSPGGPDDPYGPEGGWVTGDHTALSLAMEARKRLMK